MANFRYVSGLPIGKNGDSLSILVGPDAVFFVHEALLFGTWQYSVSLADIRQLRLDTATKLLRMDTQIEGTRSEVAIAGAQHDVETLHRDMLRHLGEIHQENLTPLTEESAQQTAGQPVPSVSIETNSRTFCPKCGHQSGSEANFCDACGELLHSSGAPHVLRPERWASNTPGYKGWPAIAIAVPLIFYIMGAFDVFLATNHLPYPIYHCVNYGNALHSEWYCDGPWSMNPFTPEIRRASTSSSTPTPIPRAAR